MKLATACALAGALFLAQSARADVTMRSKIDYKMGSYLPAAAAEMLNKQMGDIVANGVSVRIKGKRSLTSSGLVLVLSDQEKGTVTLLDPKGKRYATSTLAEYPDKLKAAMPSIPPEAAKMMESMKFDVKTDRTGKTDVFKGIKAEELLVMVTVEMPAPMTAMAMTMEMHMWAATKDELERVPALKELAAYMTAQATGTDPASMAAKMFGALPGVGDKLKGPMEQIVKASSQAVLRTQMKMKMPGTAQMMGAKDPNEPFMDMTTDLIELSAEPVPDAAFEVPADFQSAPLEDLIQLINPARQQAPRAQPPAPVPQAAAAPAAPVQAGGVFRVGGGVTAPKLVRKVEPQYDEGARQDKVEGTVLLYVQVTPEGKAANIRVLHSLGAPLDTKAIEAVQQWEFSPGTKAGQPVTVEAQIEVNFRLTDKLDG